MRVEGNKRSKPFPCIRYFFIRPVVRLLRENARAISVGGRGKREGERKNPPRRRNRMEGRGVGARGRRGRMSRIVRVEEKKKRVNLGR